MMARRLWWFVPCAVLMVVSLAACGGGGTGQAYETVADGVLRAGQPVPSPTGDAALEIGGKIASKNDAQGLELDLQTIEQLGLIRYSVDDPWLKREVSYTGVLLSDLVELMQPAKSATTLHFTALDDYEVDITLEDAARWPVMLATSLDGKRMAIENGGPTRIVFPYGLVEGIDEVGYKDLWIWNIKTITVR